MFQLTAEEAERSRSQIATLKSGRGQNIKYRPYAFTEHGGNSSPRTPIGFTADLTEKSWRLRKAQTRRANAPLWRVCTLF